MRPFCRPMAIILAFLHLLNRHTTHAAGVPSRSSHADQPDIESGSASDSSASVDFGSLYKYSTHVHSQCKRHPDGGGATPGGGRDGPRNDRRGTVLATASHDATVWTR